MPPKEEDCCLDGQDILGMSEDFLENWLDYYEDKLLNLGVRDEFFCKVCLYCRKEFPTAFKCYNHERFCKEGSTKRYPCSECNLNFKLKKFLVRHENRHSNPGSFFCTSCDAQFTTTKARMQHRIANHRIFQCHICLTRCKDSQLYVTHILNTHSCVQSEDTKEETEAQKSTGDENQGIIVNVDPLNVKREPTEEVFVLSLENPVEDKEKEKFHETEVKPTEREEDSDSNDFGGNQDFADPSCGSESDSKKKSKDDNWIPLIPKPKKRRRRRIKTYEGQKPDYECTRCGKLYIFPQKMIMHCRRLHRMNSEDEDWPKEASEATAKIFFCKYCKKNFRTESSFKGHMKTLHDELPNLPRGRKSPTLSNKPPKVKKVNKEEPTTCEVCKKSFASERKMKIHSKTHEEKPFPCMYCSKKFTRQSQLMMHTQVDHRKLRTYSCHRCPQTFTVEKCFVKHLKKLHGIEIELSSERTDCKFCKKVCFDSKSLEQHVKRAHMIDGKVQVKCTLCDEYFEEFELMEEHRASAHKDKLTCNECSKTFKNEACIRTHIRMQHTKDKVVKKKYLCGKCGKSFQCRRTHADHERSNCGKLFLYECEVCHKHFASPGTLRTHKISHTGVKAFACKFCDKSYKTKAEKLVHERSHTGEKPYQCEHCPKAFGHRESLNTHLTVHTGFKRFMCSGCGQRFTCISNLQAHRRSHAKTCGLVPNCTKTMGPMDGPLVPKIDVANDE